MMGVVNSKLLPSKDIACPNPKCKALLHVQFDDGETVLPVGEQTENGLESIRIEGQESLKLKDGKNSIGRSDATQMADLRIVTQDRTMSRLHCQIEIVKLENGRVKPIISDLRSLDKIEEKPILVNDVALTVHDRIVLDDGDYITLGETVVRYMQN